MNDSTFRTRLLGGALCLALAGAAFAALAAEDDGDKPAGKAEASAQVTTVLLRKGPIDTTVSGYGTVVGVPGKAKTLTFAQAGLVAEIRVAPGQKVTRGTVILSLITDPAGRLAYEQALSGLDLARAELERTRRMRAQSLATDSQVDQAKKSLADAEATLAAEKQLGAEAPRSELIAPFDGTILDLAVAAGDRTAPGAALAHMVPAGGGVQVLVGLAPDEARRVKAGMAAKVETVFAGGEPVQARVDHVQAVIDPQSHLVDVAVRPVAEESGLMPGEAARASIVLSTDTALLAPRAAVLSDEDGSYLFQVAGGHAKRIAVTPGAETETEIAVSGPVDPRGKVVVDGAYELEDGMAVREVPPAAKGAGEEDRK